MNKRADSKSLYWLMLVITYLCYPVAYVVKSIGSFTKDNIVSFEMYHFYVGIFSILLPIIVYFCIYSYDLKTVLKIKRPGIKELVLSFLAGISAAPFAILAGALIKGFFILLGVKFHPGNGSYPKSIGELIIIIFLSAVFPAVTEETVFRGAFLTSCEKDGFLWAVFINAFLFSIMHNNPDSFGNTFVVGVLACYIVLMTGSVFCGMAAHFAYNATLIIISSIAHFIGGSTLLLIIASGIVASVFILVYALKNIKDPTVNLLPTIGFGNKFIKTIIYLPVLFLITGYIYFIFKA